MRSLAVGAYALAMTAWGQGQQPAPGFQESVRKAMAASVDKQRASVLKQAASAAGRTATPADLFFTVPWPDAVPMVAAVQPVCDPMPAEQLNALIDENAKKQDLDAQLIRAVIGKESSNRPCVISSKGAQGLMQLMPATADQFGVIDPFDPKQNVEAGAKLLKQLLTKYKGDVALTLSAYNAGESRVDREGGIPSIPETMNYVTDILSKLPKR